jgi:hypothetical protein
MFSREREWSVEALEERVRSEPLPEAVRRAGIVNYIKYIVQIRRQPEEATRDVRVFSEVSEVIEQARRQGVQIERIEENGSREGFGGHILRVTGRSMDVDRCVAEIERGAKKQDGRRCLEEEYSLAMRRAKSRVERELLRSYYEYYRDRKRKSLEILVRRQLE